MLSCRSLTLPHLTTWFFPHHCHQGGSGSPQGHCTSAPFFPPPPHRQLGVESEDLRSLGELLADLQGLRLPEGSLAGVGQPQPGPGASLRLPLHTLLTSSGNRTRGRGLPCYPRGRGYLTLLTLSLGGVQLQTGSNHHDLPEGEAFLPSHRPAPQPRAQPQGGAC